MSRRLPRRSRAALLSAAVVLLPAAASLVCVDLGTDALAAALATPDPAGALLGLAALALAGVLAWAAAAAAAGVAEAWSGRASRSLRSPRAPGVTSAVVTRTRTGVVSAGVAALVVAALTAPAAAAGAAAGVPAVVVSQQVEQVEQTGQTGQTDQTDQTDQAAGSTPLGAPGSWAALAEDGFRAPRGASVGTASLVTAQPTRQAVHADAEVVVMAGDTLWAIAARHLGAGADDAEVAAAWPRWWEANRHTVGNDPDLLLPGQRLVVPAP